MKLKYLLTYPYLTLTKLTARADYITIIGNKTYRYCTSASSLLELLHDCFPGTRA